MLSDTAIMERRLKLLDIGKGLTIVGQRIKKHRKLRGMSLSRLAEKTGMTAYFVQRFESGRTRATVDTLNSFAKALDIEPCMFLWSKTDFAKLGRYDGLRSVISKNNPRRIHKDVLNRVGDRVRNRRFYMNLSQTELAEKAGIAQANISNVENGKTQIELATLIKLAIAMDCTVAKLLQDI